MKTGLISSPELFRQNFWLTGSFHLSEALIFKRLIASKNPQMLGELLDRPPFYSSRSSRVYVEDQSKGIPYFSNSDMMSATPLNQCKWVSKKMTKNIPNDRLEKGWTLVSRVGTIGQVTYVRRDLIGTIGSDNIIRLIPSNNIPSGYLFAFLSSKIGIELQKQISSGAVQKYIDGNNLCGIPIPRLSADQEENINQLIEQSAELRVEADLHLRQTQDRFYQQVLGIEPKDIFWKYRNEHAFAIETTHFNNQFHRLDAFHHVGYVGEVEQYLDKKISLGELIEAYQPPMFKRPYTDKNGIPFLSGIDLYNYYPKPHMFISRKMEQLESYIVESGTILVQRVGQRYGLFGRPTILPKQLDKCAVTEHLIRVYAKDTRDRGFVFIWLSTEIGRRSLLKNSFGTSMGVLSERSFTDMFCPDCSNDLRFSFEEDLDAIIQMRDHANELDDQAQSILASVLALEG